VKTHTTLFIILIGLGYHFELAPKLHQGDQRRELADRWNSINEANGDESGVFYSTTDLLDSTLIIHLAPQAATLDQDEFLDELESGDSASGELRNLGFARIRCGDRTITLHEGSTRPAMGSRALDIEPEG
jgi:hypothetical protein